MTSAKICGLTNLEDALCAVDAGADLLGFIFYPKSPRRVDVAAAVEIVAGVRRRAPNMTCVGVFVNETADDMRRVLDEVGLDFAQLHGDESRETLNALAGRAYKAVRRWNDDARALLPSPQATRHARLPDLMLDAPHDTLYGGTGLRADESVAAAIARERRLLLAGGLNPANVAEAIREVRPWGVDVASGTEASPGKKDHAKVRAFVRAVKGAG